MKFISFSDEAPELGREILVIHKNATGEIVAEMHIFMQDAAGKLTGLTKGSYGTGMIRLPDERLDYLMNNAKWLKYESENENPFVDLTSAIETEQ